MAFFLQSKFPLVAGLLCLGVSALGWLRYRQRHQAAERAKAEVLRPTTIELNLADDPNYARGKTIIESLQAEASKLGTMKFVENSPITGSSYTSVLGVTLGPYPRLANIDTATNFMPQRLP